MTAIVDTLLEDLDDLSSTMATNLTNKGVTASASDGLTTLANKIADISQNDYLYEHPDEFTCTNPSTNSNVWLLDNDLSLELPLNFILDFDYKGNINEARAGLYSISNLAQRNYILSVQISTNDYVGVYRTTSTTGVNSGRLSANNNEYHNCKIIVCNSVGIWVLNNTNVGVVSGLNWITSKNNYTIGVWTYNSGTAYLKNLKLIEL